MGRLIALVLGIAVVAGVAYVATGSSTGPAPASAPPGAQASERLHNVRQAAQDIEAEQQKRLEDTYNKALGEPSQP